jgi:2-polyprenyl-6-methoxyphenol hydroxylase-like FAD-dependent oxidoreductase
MISWENMKPLLIQFDVIMGSFCCFGRRVGLKAVVLEQSDKLRPQGTTMTLWNNGMRILEIFGLADQFRSMYLNVPGYVLVFHKHNYCRSMVVRC